MDYEPPRSFDVGGAYFIRVDDRLYRTQFLSEGSSESHRGLASDDGLMTEIEELKRDDPTRLDAGFLKIQKNNLWQPTILVEGRSVGLSLPDIAVENEARNKTKNLVNAKSSRFEVEATL